MKIPRALIIFHIILMSSISGAEVEETKVVKTPIFPIISYILSSKSSKPVPGVHPNRYYPMYWEINGARTLLLGGFDSGEPFLLTGNALTAPLDELAAVGGNYLRNTMADFTASIGGDGRLHPFFRLTGGLFDLDQWNDAYWQQLDIMLNEAARRDIIVSLELFDPWNLRDEGSPELYWWKDGPWSPGMNINYSTATGLSDIYHWLPWEKENPFYTSITGDPATRANMAPVLKYQRAFVLKILETAAPYNNVLFQIDNESFAPTDWVDYWADFIHANSDGRYVTDMRNEQDLDTSSARHAINNPSLFDFADASQIDNGYPQDKRYAQLVNFRKAMISSGKKRPINQIKVYSSIGTVSGGVIDPDIGLDRFFMDVFAGTAAVRFHKPPVGEGLGVSAKRVIKSVRWLEKQINLAFMTPISLDDWRWVFRREADVYAMEGGNNFVFGYSSVNDGSCTDVDHPCLPAGHGIRFNMSALDGIVSRTWINADTGEIRDGGAASTSTWVNLVRPDAPNNARWICIVKKVN